MWRTCVRSIARRVHGGSCCSYSRHMRTHRPCPMCMHMHMHMPHLQPCACVCARACASACPWYTRVRGPSTACTVTYVALEPKLISTRGVDRTMHPCRALDPCHGPLLTLPSASHSQRRVPCAGTLLRAFQPSRTTPLPVHATTRESTTESGTLPGVPLPPLQHTGHR